MRLAQRLWIGSLLVIGGLIVLLVLLIDRRVGAALVGDARRTLEREARLVGAQWGPRADPDSLADAAARLLGAHVTLVHPDGRIAGDSRFDPSTAATARLSGSPEVGAALRSGSGRAVRDAPGGGEELHVAVRVPLGVARLSLDTRVIEAPAGRARRDVLIGGLVGLLLATAAAALFARQVSRPIVGLRDVATRIAGGDLGRRARVGAPGEVGELAGALNRMGDALAARFRAIEADDALLSTLIESLNEGVIAIDAAGQVVRINRAGRRLLALDVPVPFPTDYLPRDRALREAVRDSLGGAATEPIEIGVGGRTLALTTRPLPDGGAVLTLFDLTPLRRLETMRRDFVANASHELKTPLTVIGGFAETLAEDDPPDGQRRQFAASIRSNARRMQRLVDDLLDLSRIESGGWTPNPAWIDVRTAAEDVLAPKRDEARRRGLELRVDIATGGERVYADPTALRQMLDNLVDNALRYTERGSVLVSARPAGAGVELGVEDTGSGILAQHLGRIFERFYRADPARSREAGGTGLGLAIVRHLVEAHGGRVRAESTVGKGTRVAALFPAPDPARSA